MKHPRLQLKEHIPAIPLRSARVPSDELPLALHAPSPSRHKETGVRRRRPEGITITLPPHCGLPCRVDPSLFGRMDSHYAEHSWIGTDRDLVMDLSMALCFVGKKTDEMPVLLES